VSTDIDPGSLPAYDRISESHIRDAAAAWDAAKAAHEQARKDLNELELTREAAEWRDAENVDRARSERKPDPRRTHVGAHDRKTDTAKHELKVRQLAAQRAERELLVALDKHGASWGEEVAHEAESLQEQFSMEVATLSELYGRLSNALSVGKVFTGGRQPRIGALDFSPRQVQGREYASGQPQSVRPYIAVGDVLAALSDLGKVEPEPEPVVQPPLVRTPSSLESMAPVAAEMSSRDAVQTRREQLLAEQDEDE
jgi:hypothetical protein